MALKPVMQQRIFSSSQRYQSPVSDSNLFNTYSVTWPTVMHQFADETQIDKLVEEMNDYYRTPHSSQY